MQELKLVLNVNVNWCLKKVKTDTFMNVGITLIANIRKTLYWAINYRFRSPFYSFWVLDAKG